MGFGCYAQLVFAMMWPCQVVCATSSGRFAMSLIKLASSKTQILLGHRARMTFSPVFSGLEDSIIS